jgi:Zn-dependent peptidase ImmA (M78 family)/DNA-binding XRE family transcriptional regulator
MTNHKLIIGSQLRQARELLKFTVEDIARDLGVGTNEVANWEREIASPDLAQLESLSRLYGRDIDYFLKDTLKPPADLEFRGKPGKSLIDLSKETRLVIANYDELCRTVYEIENLMGTELRVKLSRLNEDYSPKAAARTLRAKLSLDDKPIPKLRDILENEGFRIFELSIPNEEISGFSYWHNKYGPCVLINADEPIGRRNFTLAHELAHLLFNHGSSVCFISSGAIKGMGNIEYKANQFAVELLLPESKILEDFRNKGLSRNPSLKELRKLSYKWGVSNQALGYRLESLDLIESGYTDTLTEPKPIFRRPTIPKWKRKLGNQYVRTSIEAYKKNLITIGKLAHALQLPVSKAIEEVKQRSEKTS